MSNIESTATIRTVVDNSAVEAGMRPVVDAARRAEQAVAQIGNGAGTSARNVDAGARNIVAAIQRTTAAMEAGGRQTAAYYEAMARQRGVDPAVLAPYLAQLRAVEQAQARTAASAGASAGQIAAAMRTVPAQVTDIVTALQGGQRPLTVLLQQGGQLRDQFGSAGTAARALGGYVLGLLNPFTIGAAAVAALAYAYKVGTDEAGTFQRALIMSGNAAGATASQLTDVSRNVAAITGSLAGADTVAKLVQTAQIPAESLQKFAQAAIGAQELLGRSIEDTVQEFAELGRTPLAALDKIDAKYHTISAATREQVKALQDQGRATEAATVAQEAHFRAIEDQKDKVLATLQSWQKAWLGLKMYAADAANAVIDFAGGRGTSDFDKINTLLKAREGIQAELDRAQARGLAANVAGLQAELDANLRAIDAIRDKGAAQREAARAAAEGQKIDDAQKQWAKDGEKYLTRQAQLTRDLTTAANEGAVAFAKLDPAEREKKIADRLSEIRKSYSDIYNAGVDSQIAALKRKEQVEDALAQRETARIAAQRALGNISDSDAIKQTAELEIAQIGRAMRERQAELGLVKQKANSIKEQADLEGQINVLRIQRVTREKQEENDLLTLAEKRRAASEALYISGITGATNELEGLRAQLVALADYNQEIGLSKTQVAELRAARLQNAAALKDEAAAALEAREAGSELARIYREQAEALRDQADAGLYNANKEQRVDQWRQAVQQYDQVFQQGFADMLNNGQKGWSSFTKSLVTTFKTTVADEIYKLFARPFIVQMVGNFLGIGSQAIAGEIASQQGLLGGGQASAGGAASGPIGAAQAASRLYDALKPGGSLESTLANGVRDGLGKLGVSPGTASQYGQFAGAAGLTVGGYMIGSGLNSAISGQYSTGSGFMATEKIATAVASYFAGPLGGAVAGAIGGLVNRAFGMGPKEVTAQGVRGTLSASSLAGQNYTSYHQDGGWFRSDRNETDTSAFSADMVKQFTQGLSAIEQASSGFAAALGVKADAITSYSKTFDIALTGDATKDQQAIADFFKGIGDEIAQRLVPNLDAFTKSGETAAAALQRLAGDFKATDQVAQLIGKTAAEAFGATGIASAKAREQLIGFAGDISSLTSQAQTYAQNYLSEAEKLAPVQKALDAALASLGLSAVQTRDQFKAVVNSLDLTTEAGAKQFASLMALADAFAQVHPSSAVDTARILQERQGLQDQLDELTMTSTQLLAKQRDALDESNRALFDQIHAVTAQKTAAQAALDMLNITQKAASDAIKAAQSSSAETMKTFGDAFQASMDNARNAAKALREFNDSLLLGNLSALDPEAKYREAKRLYEKNPTDTQAAQAFLQASKDRGVDDFFYQRDFASVQSKIAAGAAAKDAYADSLPAFWRMVQQSMNPDPVAPVYSAGMTSAVRASVVASAPSAAVETKVDSLINTLGGTMQIVADSTAKLAEQFDRVTDGGNGMVSA